MNPFETWSLLQPGALRKLQIGDIPTESTGPVESIYYRNNQYACVRWYYGNTTVLWVLSKGKMYTANGIVQSFRE